MQDSHCITRSLWSRQNYPALPHFCLQLSTCSADRILGHFSLESADPGRANRQCRPCRVRDVPGHGASAREGSILTQGASLPELFRLKPATWPHPASHLVSGGSDRRDSLLRVEEAGPVTASRPDSGRQGPSRSSPPRRRMRGPREPQPPAPAGRVSDAGWRPLAAPGHLAGEPGPGPPRPRRTGTGAAPRGQRAARRVDEAWARSLGAGPGRVRLVHKSDSNRRTAPPAHGRGRQRPPPPLSPKRRASSSPCRQVVASPPAVNPAPPPVRSSSTPPPPPGRACPPAAAGTRGRARQGAGP